MKRLFILILALTLVLYAFPAPAEQDDTDEILTRGINAYTSGDYATALEAFSTCVDRGLVVGYYCMAILYAYGLGVEQSYERAAEYVKVSAEYDHPESLHLLALLYLNGLGVEQSQELAIEHLHKAVSLGYEPAQELLDTIPREDDGADPAEQLRRKAIYAGMELPEPGEGERLYLGMAAVPDTKLSEIYIALIAAPNLMTIHSVVLYGYGMEVPREGTEPYLLNAIQSSADNEIIARNAQSGIAGFTFGGESKVEQLTLDETGGSCTVTIAGICELERDGVDGTYKASADVTLYNLSGDAAMDPIDPPTAEQIRAAGMNLPETAEGETLFIGQAKISQAKSAYVLFVRTADGSSIRNLSYLIMDMTLEYKTENARINTTSSNYSGTSLNPVDVSEDLSFGSLRISSFAMDEDTASGILRVAYHDTSHNVDYPLDPAWIRFVKAE